MSMYVCIIGLVLATVFVGSHITGTIIAKRMCDRTCRLLDMQIQEIERALYPRIKKDCPPHAS